MESLSLLISAIALFTTQLTVQPTQTTAQTTTEAIPLERQPRGEYYYENTAAGRPRYLLLRHTSRTVIGIDMQPIGAPMCFRGWLEDDRVVNAIALRPPYQPDSRLSRAPVLLDLTDYQPATAEPSQADRAALRSCINFFWR